MQPVPSAELSLDISRVVAKMMRGDQVDTSGAAAELAEKYPTLGMSGAMIEEAISRAAGMVGMIRAAPAGGEEEAPPPEVSSADGFPSPIEAAFDEIDFSEHRLADKPRPRDRQFENSLDDIEPFRDRDADGPAEAGAGILAKSASAFRAIFRR
jgi:hypothetical protein